ncbi:hypothetical protein EHP00_2293 [Ecytonucleospora hepatopenaei]|uniref:Uncharacterized protein n=1 Tax=Ecytonucleospora hepatopenaei TaxID=646526 RepID=A0A1W0E3Q4_9MICR|nr:hypothetical protein EHP00_2293 [Ecytonucleospora hepatopenaei]
MIKKFFKLVLTFKKLKVQEPELNYGIRQIILKNKVYYIDIRGSKIRCQALLFRSIAPCGKGKKTKMVKCICYIKIRVKNKIFFIQKSSLINDDSYLIKLIKKHF